MPAQNYVTGYQLPTAKRSNFYSLGQPSQPILYKLFLSQTPSSQPGCPTIIQKIYIYFFSKCLVFIWFSLSMPSGRTDNFIDTEVLWLEGHKPMSEANAITKLKWIMNHYQWGLYENQSYSPESNRLGEFPSHTAPLCLGHPLPAYPSLQILPIIQG